MSLIDHHIYEFKKEVRGLFLHTISNGEVENIRNKLETQGICCVVYRLNDRSSNTFFGKPDFVEVVERFGERKLNELTAEEDFILGIMLGYGQDQQCRRYLTKKQRDEAGMREIKNSCFVKRKRRGHERKMQLQR